MAGLPPVQNSLRLFVALTVPEDTRARIAEAQAKLRRVLREASISWTRPEQFHLTVKFLGAVRDSDVEPLCAALSNVCAGFAPLNLTSTGVGFFPRVSRPRVVWTGLEDGTGQLPGLHAAVESSVGLWTREKPENRFHAHVTIGRVKEAGRDAVEAMREWAGEYSKHVFGSWEASGAALIQSKLSPKGATHSVLAEFPFAKQ